VVAAHGLGGTVGALLTGLLASRGWNGPSTASFTATRPAGIQAVGVVAAIAYSGAASYVLLKAIALVTPLKVDVREEGLGLDVSEHGEEAYAGDEGAILVLQREGADAPVALPAIAAATAEGGRS